MEINLNFNMDPVEFYKLIDSYGLRNLGFNNVSSGFDDMTIKNGTLDSDKSYLQFYILSNYHVELYLAFSSNFGSFRFSKNKPLYQAFNVEELLVHLKKDYSISQRNRQEGEAFDDFVKRVMNFMVPLIKDFCTSQINGGDWVNVPNKDFRDY